MAKSYTAVKAHSDATDGFDKTVKWWLGMASNVETNANKFYCLELQHNATTGQYRLFSHYGRLVGSTVENGVYDVRGPDTDLASMEAEFEDIKKSKEKGKTKTRDDGTKFKEQYLTVDVVAPTCGSPNIRKNSGVASSTVSKSNGNSGLAMAFSNYSPQPRKILDQLLRDNIHSITTSTTFTMTASGGLQTPLGPLTLEHCDKVTEVLDLLKPFIPDTQGGVADVRDPAVRDYNNRLFSLVPRPFAHGKKIQDSDLVTDMQRLLAEYDLLDQMRSTVTVTSTDGSDSKKHDLGMLLEIADSDTTKYLFDYVERSRKHRNLDNWKPVRCYTFENVKERSRYNSRSAQLRAEGATAKKSSHVVTGSKSIQDYEEIDLFHGSKNANVLSIMLNGFYVPPVNASFVTGRMFGPTHRSHVKDMGVYGADSSTKSLNYSIGNWSRSGYSGGGNSTQNTFLFITRFAMGRIYATKRSLPDGAPAGYHSIFAQGGADLQNNEYITSPSQTTITHVIELESRR